MSVRRCDRLLTNSRYTASAIRRAYGRDAEVARLGIPDRFMRASPNEPIEHVLSVGALIPSKGHDLAVQTVAAAGMTLPLVVVAPRSVPEEERRLRGLAQHLNVSLDLRIGITDKALQTAYGRALATVYLARDEPYGLASIEAQACGCPVVVSDEGGLPETLVDGVTGWAVPRDPRPASERLVSLLDENTRRAMGEAAATHGRGYDWRYAIHDLENEIARAANGRGG